MKFRAAAFGSINKFHDADALPPSAAPDAIDVDVRNGKLYPAKVESAAVATPAKVGTKLSIYRFGKDLTTDTQYWFHWLNDTDATRGPIPNDVTERTFYTESGQVPKVTDNTIALASTAYPHASYTLGYASPQTPTATVSGTGTGTAAVIAVAVSYVSAWGDVGPPSVAVNATITPGQTLTVGNLPTAPPANSNVTQLRIWISSIVSSGQAAYRRWVTINIGPTSYAAVPDLTLLGDAIDAPYLIAPPTDLFGIASHPGGFLFGFSGKLFCRSGVERPYGWPDEYKDPVETDIVGGALMGHSVVICAKRGTYIATGRDPSNQSIEQVRGLKDTCVSKRSIVSNEYGVLYAGAAGIVLIRPDGGWELPIEELMKADEWATYVPSSMLGTYFEGQYILFYDKGGGLTGSLVLDMRRRQLTRSTIHATAAFSEPGRRALYLQIGADIVKWRAGVGTRTLTWLSRVINLPRAVFFSIARVRAATYPLTFRLYQSGVLTHTQTVTNDDSFAVSPVRRNTVQVEIIGGSGISEVEIAANRVELLKPDAEAI